MAFYKIENGAILKSDNDLFGPGYDLLISEHENYNYPVFEWYWFDNDKEAEAFFGISMELPLSAN